MFTNEYFSDRVSARTGGGVTKNVRTSFVDGPTLLISGHFPTFKKEQVFLAEKLNDFRRNKFGTTKRSLQIKTIIN